MKRNLGNGSFNYRFGFLLDDPLLFKDVKQEKHLYKILTPNVDGASPWLNCIINFSKIVTAMEVWLSPPTTCTSIGSKVLLHAGVVVVEVRAGCVGFLLAPLPGLHELDGHETAVLGLDSLWGFHPLFAKRCRINGAIVELLEELSISLMSSENPATVGEIPFQVRDGESGTIYFTHQPFPCQCQVSLLCFLLGRLD